MDILELMPQIEVEVEIPIEVDGDLETESETIVIKDFSDFDAEVVDSYEKNMGPELQHLLTGVVVDSHGNSHDVKINVWEYPIGAIDTIEVEETSIV